MSVCMGVVIIVFQRMNNQEAISAVFTLASYTYGPIPGLFTFGLLSRRQVRGHFVPFICLLSPALCYGIKQCLLLRFGYVMSFELLLLNAALTAFGLWLASSRRSGS